MSNNPFKSPLAESEPMQATKHRPWLRYALGTLTIGFLVAFLGVCYGVLAVGLPSPDSPPEVQQREQFHLGISKALVLAGVCLFAFGVMAFGVTILSRSISRIRSSAGSGQRGL
ncbi:MAG: hypothetical protein P8L85_10730 [Rubripirellula sp.]|nr:hypothetical protein [Rubripirellula sp.]